MTVIHPEEMYPEIDIEPILKQWLITADLLDVRQTKDLLQRMAVQATKLAGLYNKWEKGYHQKNTESDTGGTYATDNVSISSTNSRLRQKGQTHLFTPASYTDQAYRCRLNLLITPELTGVIFCGG